MDGSGQGCDQAGRRVGAERWRPAGGVPAAVPHRLGAAAAGADRHGGRPCAVHRPEPVAQPVPGCSFDRQAVVDVPARLEVRPQDHVLPAVAAGHAYRPGHRRHASQPSQRAAQRCRRRHLLPGEPRDLRGLRVTTTTSATTSSGPVTERHMLLDPGMDLTLRPMRYPHFYDRFRDAIKNTWTVEEVDLHSDLADLARLSAAERHLVSRLVAFFATGDTIVANNLVLNLYQHVNSPEARLYLSRQLFEEAVHVQFYLTLLDTYVPDAAERAAAFAAVENIPSIRRKAEFCFRWIDSIYELRELRTAADRRSFLLNLICFAACIEGLFFYGAFAYVYFLRSRGLLNGLASGTNWVFRDESMHMAFAFDVVEAVRPEEPGLFDEQMAGQARLLAPHRLDDVKREGHVHRLVA